MKKKNQYHTNARARGHARSHSEYAHTRLCFLTDSSSLASVGVWVMISFREVQKGLIYQQVAASSQARICHNKEVETIKPYKKIQHGANYNVKSYLRWL